MDFDDFYLSERGRVLGLCVLVTLDVEAAADVTQEAMLRAWQRWDRVGGEHANAWVRTVALNLCRSRWRRLQRELRHTSRAEPVAPGPEVRDPALLDALRRLPRRQREAVSLFYFADRSLIECSKEMGVTVGAVKRHLSRARAHLGDDRTLSPYRIGDNRD